MWTKAFVYASMGFVLAVSPAAAGPTQFIAKMYTEALGRIPDQGGWQGAANYFNSNGCTSGTLKIQGRGYYLSTEYQNLGYDNAARLLTLYRGVLNREPEAAGFNNNLNALNSGTSWTTMVDSFFDSFEFIDFANGICGPLPDYSFGNKPVIDLPVTGAGFTGSQAALQAQLNATASGGTVFLAQKAVVRLTSPLTIPAGVTLATTGNPSVNKYALMGRLVRNSAFTDAAVKLSSGAKLKNVWVDGQRGVVGFTDNGLNVQLLGGTGTEVSTSVLTNTAGWSTLQALGRAEGRTCGSNTISGNMVTAYSSNHYLGTWSDGLSVSCENALVENNEVIDATDVSIIVFRAYPAIQRTIVRNNRILAAGNSAFAALAYDGLTGTTSPSYSGSSIESNTLWTSSDAHFDLGISVGTRAWFGAQTNTGTGATVKFNTTGSLSARVDTGIAVSGMLNANVQNNTLAVTLVDLGACPSASVGASVSAGYASGTIQSYTDLDYNACVGH